MGKSKITVRDMTFIALFAVVIALCAWISVPGPIPFTMQTFGVFMAVGVLGGRRGSIAVFVYLMLGVLGLPVFAGFQGGVGRLLGMTGGYIVGFQVAALTMWLMEGLVGKKRWGLALSMVLGLILCYLFGTVWFVVAYSRQMGPIGFWAALSTCVIPYVIPDLLKIFLAFSLSKRIATAIRLS